MRKALACVLCATFLFVAGCSGAKVSDKAASVAKNAVTIADSYLDNEISQEKARNKLDALEADMSYVDDMSPDDKNKAGDFSVSVSVTILSSAILNDSIDGTRESYDKVIEVRNDLASHTGMKKR